MSSSESQRNVLVCALCRKQFADPRYLLCLHTFCRNCIKSNAGRVLKGNSKEYPCPLCQRKTPISDKGDKWIDELPVNDLILNIINAKKLQKGEVSCVPCSRKGKSVKATNWCNACREGMCDECNEVHNTLQSTMKHDTVRISQLRKRTLQEVAMTPLCAEHGEKLTKFCKDHDKAICTSCAANSHRACKDVLTIEDMAKERKGMYRDVKGTLEKQMINANLLVEDRNDAFSFFDNTSLNTRSVIESVRKKLNDVLIKCEKKALKDLDDVCEKEKSGFQSQISATEHLAEESGNALALVDTAMRDASDVDRIQWLGKFDDESGRLAQDLQTMDAKIPRSSLDFKIQQQIQEVMKSVDTLGELVLSKEGKSSSENKFVKPTQNKPTVKVYRTLPLKTPEPRQAERTFSARTPSDDEPCWITGIVNLSSNLWVFADKSNSKLKIYTDEFKLMSEYFIEQAPFDVTAIDQSQIGVSIPAENKIQIYDVKTGIDPVKSVKIKAQCYGISFSNNMFVVACPLSAPPSVRFVSLDGQEMTQMSPRDNVIPLFLRPLYVKYYPTGVDFAVSDANKNHVSCLNRAVFRHFKYVNFNLTGPRGITLTQNGELYACGWGSDNVHKIDGNGKYVEEILNRHNGIISPQNICVSANQKLLLVTLDLTSGNSDTISVFEL